MTPVGNYKSKGNLTEMIQRWPRLTLIPAVLEYHSCHHCQLGMQAFWGAAEPRPAHPHPHHFL